LRSLFPGAIRSPQIIEFLAHLLRHLPGKLLIVWDGLPAHRSRAVWEFVQHQRDWKLLTDLPVRSRQEAIEKIQWYAQRWKIETFHKILKSGCKVEESKLRAAERLVNLVAVLCILGWRIFWMTMINRATPDAVPDIAFTELELYLLDELVRDKASANRHSKPLSAYLTKLARLGGYLARAHDAPPGNKVMWREPPVVLELNQWQHLYGC
jgi:hypothetical protein